MMKLNISTVRWRLSRCDLLTFTNPDFQTISDTSRNSLFHSFQHFAFSSHNFFVRELPEGTPLQKRNISFSFESSLDRLWL